MVKFRTAYVALAKDVRQAMALYCGEGRTHQSAKDECDINVIMARWEKSRIIEHVSRTGGSYGDFLDVPQDFHAAMQQVIEAEEAFSSLPSSIRKRFANDPGAFLEFVGDPANENEMRSMGLLKAVEAAGAASQEKVEERSERAAADGAEAP